MPAPHSRTGEPACDRWGFRAEGARSPDARSDHRLAERLAHLHAASAALSAAVTSAEVVSAAASCGAALQGACGCAVALLQPEGFLEVSARRGATELLSGRSRALAFGAPFPVARAARERRPVFLEAPRGAKLASAALPLESGGELLGAMGVVFAAPLAFDDEQRSFLEALARESAQALQRARLYEAERDARLAAQRSEEAARRAMELEERLLGIVGHDLRTPLAAIRMSTALLFRGGGLTREQARTLARVGASAARMTRIIRDLLDFTRVRKEGGLPVSFRAVDLGHLARRAVAELAAVHPDRDLRLLAAGSATVSGDPDRLLQVLTNLLGNAVQHGPPRSPVRVSVGPEGGEVVLRVHNEGPPVPAELQTAMFEPFRRGPGGDEDGSLGLGLFIVREIVRAHGGAIEVRSSEGEGTTFTVRLHGRSRGLGHGFPGGSYPELERRPAER
jgi:signal transduction histidine kinase